MSRHGNKLIGNKVIGQLEDLNNLRLEFVYNPEEGVVDVSAAITRGRQDKQLQTEFATGFSLSVDEFECMVHAMAEMCTHCTPDEAELFTTEIH
tara:strand:+ start:397 stop:678 length:282 start_codon:yes stop_codon:yes gene_type:complete